MTASWRNNCDRIVQQETDAELRKIGPAENNTVTEQNGKFTVEPVKSHGASLLSKARVAESGMGARSSELNYQQVSGSALMIGDPIAIKAEHEDANG